MTAEAMGFVLRPDLLPQGYDGLVPGGEAQRLTALARALTSSPAWPPHAVAVVAARSSSPLLAILGRLDKAEEARIRALENQLSVTRLIYVDYQQVATDVALLADRLAPWMTGRWVMAGVPRGGLIVAGMLSYLLAAPASSMVGVREEAESVVLVDDCALSGHRLRQVLGASGARRVVFATLYSAPELRQAILDQEDRVVACVSARDLNDQAAVMYGDGYDEWVRRWSERSDAYWAGRTEHVCFPWNEPDLSVWNPVTEAVERGWNLVPPELCLKNRRPASTAPVQIQEPGRGPLREAEGVVYGEVAGDLVVVKAGSPDSVRLSGTGAAMWRAVMHHGDIDEAGDQVAMDYGADPDTVRADLGELIDRLAERGFLDLTGVSAPR